MFVDLPWLACSTLVQIGCNMWGKVCFRHNHFSSNIFTHAEARRESKTKDLWFKPEDLCLDPGFLRVLRVSA